MTKLKAKVVAWFSPLQAMGRIFVGLCQVGAWGCFDEFNRLEERMLSAVSQQVQYIQVALREHSNPNRDRSTSTVCPACDMMIKAGGLMERCMILVFRRCFSF